MVYTPDSWVVIRGILCGNCNTALGKLGDSVEAIENVLLYLKGTTNGT